MLVRQTDKLPTYHVDSATKAVLGTEIGPGSCIGSKMTLAAIVQSECMSLQALLAST